MRVEQALPDQLRGGCVCVLDGVQVGADLLSTIVEAV
jgi:hypothetical protein